MSGPDYLNPESHVPMLRMVFEQCLCCFRFNAEVWLSYALFERDEVPKRAVEAPQQPPQVIPCVTMCRCDVGFAATAWRQ
jgi:predicted Fe-S protein YdhL (DUF1289 family)